MSGTEDVVVLPPTPPPRHPVWINNIVQKQQSSGGDERVHLGRVENVSPQHRHWKPKRSGVLGSLQFQDSSESSSDSTSTYPAAMSTMNATKNHESCERNPAPLRAVVTPTNRCSSYDNVEEVLASCQPSSSSSSQLHHLGKPPNGSLSDPKTTRTLNRGSSPVALADRTSPRNTAGLHHHYFHYGHHRPSPSPAALMRHCHRSDNNCATSTGLRQSPSSTCGSASMSPCAINRNPSSGRSTPSRQKNRIPHQDSSVEPRSSWNESSNRSSCEDGDSIVSDLPRRRPHSSCRASTPESDGGDGFPPSLCRPAPCFYNWQGSATLPQASWGCCGAHHGMSGAAGLGSNYDLQQQLCLIESEKEHLALQVSVLVEQVDAQDEKIKDLEINLKDSHFQLSHMQASLRQEMEYRQSLEKHKFELLAEVSSLNMKLAAVEQDRKDVEEKNYKLESELVISYAHLAEKEVDLAILRSMLAKNGIVDSVNDCDPEIQKFKNALASVVAANDAKEKKIQDLKASLSRYKKIHELVFSKHTRKVADCSMNRSMGEDLGNLDLIAEVHSRADLCDGRITEKPPLFPRIGQQPFTTTSSPLHLSQSLLTPSREAQLLRCSPILRSNCNSLPLQFSQRANSSDNIHPHHESLPVERHYGTMPRQHSADTLKKIHEQLEQHKHSQPTKTNVVQDFVDDRSPSPLNVKNSSLDMFRQSRSSKPSGMSFGKGFFKLRSGKRSSSAPELALEDKMVVMKSPDTQSLHRNTGRNVKLTISTKGKPRGLRKLFGKLKRTGSESLDSNCAEFKRGGIRATSGPRLGWTQEGNKLNLSNVPFAQWTSSMILDWIQSIGLGMYSQEFKKRVKSGNQLLRATKADFEKELGIKNPLHRKKLLLSITAMIENHGTPSYLYQKLDYHWIIRWFDDIGLPQYKDIFFDARVDGQVLHHLTIEDLFHLKVTNQLHYISIKRGIQVLRENLFDPQCLKRRFTPGDGQASTDVSKWTNHRVMEWLRTVDLSEYAPNLRGSGVHGGLMVYEPSFSADLLATLLNIPPNKTLLRRHLSTQFKQLVGADLMQRKREWEAQNCNILLSPSAKIKIVRKGQISILRKKNKTDVELEDYVCPMDSVDLCLLLDSSNVANSSKSVSNTQHDTNVLSENEERAIGDETQAALNSLNDLLQDKNLFEKLTTTNV